MLDFIREHVKEKGYPPTLREIGEVAGISSTSVVAYHLNHLEGLGFITREKFNAARAIKVETEENIYRLRRLRR